MPRIIPILLMLIATTAFGGNIQKWETPSGKVYVGTNPPAGAVQVKKLKHRTGSITAPKLPNQNVAQSQIRKGDSGRKNSNCLNRVRITRVVAMHFGESGSILEGQGKVIGQRRVSTVSVCGGGQCDRIYPDVLEPGTEFDFYIPSKTPELKPNIVRAHCAGKP